jgi:hypothetical protein
LENIMRKLLGLALLIGFAGAAWAASSAMDSSHERHPKGHGMHAMGASHGKAMMEGKGKMHDHGNMPCAMSSQDKPPHEHRHDTPAK